MKQSLCVLRRTTNRRKNVRALLYKIRRAFLNGTLISHYVLNKSFRVNISLLVSLVPNLIYLVFNLISGIRYRSISFTAVAFYYALHVYIRYTILNISDTQDEEKLIYASKKGGIFLLLADVLIAPMLIFGAFTGESTSYGAPVLAFLAIYALYTLISASVGIIKGKSERLPIRRTAHSVRLASGAMSLFNLISALILSYAPDGSFSERVTAILGISVSLLVLYLSLSMIFLPVKYKNIKE